MKIKYLQPQLKFPFDVEEENTLFNYNTYKITIHTWKYFVIQKSSIRFANDCC